MGLVSRLDAISNDVGSTTDIDDLEDHLGALSVFLDEAQQTESTFLGINPGVQDEYNLKPEENDQVAKIGADILGKAAELHAEKGGYRTYFEANLDLVESVSGEMRRLGELGKMVNELGHNTHFTEQMKESGASAYMFFDEIEDRIGVQTPLDFAGDTSGTMNLMDAHVEGLKQFAETGSKEYYKHATYGIEKFGHMMRADTIDKLADIGKCHSEVVKLRTMAAIIDGFQAHNQPDDIFSLAHPEFAIADPEGYPEVAEYRRWLKNDDLDSYLDEVYVESIRSGADMLRYAREEDKEEMAKNYVFAIGFLERASELNLLRVSSMERGAMQRDIERFKSELPDSVLYPKSPDELSQTARIGHDNDDQEAHIGYD